jgi:hypothetical protein
MAELKETVEGHLGSIKRYIDVGLEGTRRNVNDTHSPEKKRHTLLTGQRAKIETEEGHFERMHRLYITSSKDGTRTALAAIMPPR